VMSFTPLGKHFAFGMNSTLKLFGKVPKDMEVSPFLPRVTAAHPPRLMDGVRRLIGAHPSPSTKKVKSKIGLPEKDEKHTHEDGPDSIDPNALETIVEHHLAPAVSPSELAEYEWYVEQYKTLLTAPDWIAERKDLEMYHLSVATALGGRGGDSASAEGAESTIGVTPEKAYFTYLVNAAVGVGPVNVPSLPDYEKWIASGTHVWR